VSVLNNPNSCLIIFTSMPIGASICVRKGKSGILFPAAAPSRRWLMNKTCQVHGRFSSLMNQLDVCSSVSQRRTQWQGRARKSFRKHHAVFLFLLSLKYREKRMERREIRCGQAGDQFQLAQLALLYHGFIYAVSPSSWSGKGKPLVLRHTATNWYECRQCMLFSRTRRFWILTLEN
jgi:hypothetical protein